jgi:transitional endoplasmic reticulum ATPase
MSESCTAIQEINLKVGESIHKDVGRGLARMDPADMSRLGVEIGDFIEVVGRKAAVCRLLPAYKEHRGNADIQIDGIVRENAGIAVGDTAILRRVSVQSATEVVLEPLSGAASHDLEQISSLLDGLPIVIGDRVRVVLCGNHCIDFLVKSAMPHGPVVIDADTLLKFCVNRKNEATATTAVMYEDIGGMRRQVARVRESVELPLRHADYFGRLNMEVSKAILFVGPPGCGKTLLAKAAAHEAEANFFTVPIVEFLQKFNGESENTLRKVFEDAVRRAPSIIFIKGLDAISLRPEPTEAERHFLTQLSTFLDRLSPRQRVVVLASTRSPDALPTMLRQPGRFDHEIWFSIPDRHEREEILEIHSRGMPLAVDVDTSCLATMARGFVGADLESLCRAAKATALRRLLPQIDFSQRSISPKMHSQLQMTMADFQAAFGEVPPSAIGEVLFEVPDVHWEDIGGLEDAKRQLQETVEWPMKYATLFKALPVHRSRGVLLYGPAGCGKTRMATALASETGVNLVTIKGPEVLAMCLRESDYRIREIFHRARRSRPCMIFFDEIDALASSQFGGGSRILSQLLMELDAIDALNDVLVLAATNRRDLLDSALLRLNRFTLQIEVPLPDRAAREKIFQIHMRDLPVAADVTAVWLAEQTEGFSGADIESVCHRAMMAALAMRITTAPDQPDITALRVRREHVREAIYHLLTRTACVEHE